MAAQAAAGTRGRSVEPIPVVGGRPSPRAPIRVLPRWRGAAMGVPARIITSGPTASDPTRSLPFPPAATPCLLQWTSSYSQVVNSRVRQGQRQRTIRQCPSYTQSYKSSRNSQRCSPHSKPPSRRVVVPISKKSSQRTIGSVVPPSRTERILRAPTSHRTHGATDRRPALPGHRAASPTHRETFVSSSNSSSFSMPPIRWRGR